MISKFFIEHPVLSNVISILFVLLGIVAIARLPVSQYPQIVPPTIQVTANYPGADPKTLIKTVAQPIEQQVNGVENMLYMQSNSTNTGNYTLIVTFAIGTDLNFAQVLVQNRVQAAMAQLPQAVQQQGVVVQQKSTAILQFVTLTSKNKHYDASFLYNYAKINMQNELARLSGVGNVLIFGSGQYAMRIWLDPKKMQAFSLVPKDVLNAIKTQNTEVTAGQIGGQPAASFQANQFTVNVPGELADPAQFENIIIKSVPSQSENPASTSGRIVRIRDVGRVELGSSSYNQLAKLNGNPTAAIGIYQLPGANALQVAEEVRVAVQRMAKKFPEGLQYDVPFDTTVFVKASIHEVYKTLGEAGILVLIVIIVFLQNMRATLVPATTVPVTIIGAFAAMAMLGYTINLLTLFGLVLAIGIVVDDAIVVVEGVTQHIERGSSPKQAAIDAMGELFGPILGITLVLMSVFIPAGFMPGLTGQMYAQFALVIASTAVISAINAATLKPTQCALWLKPIDPNHKKNAFFRGFDRLYNALETRYMRLLEKMVHKSGKMVSIALLLIVLAVLGLAWVPTGFVPIEDQGYMVLSVLLPDGASLNRTDLTLNRLSKEAEALPGVSNVIAIDGVSLLDSNAGLANGGVLYVMFKDWATRGKALGLLPMYNALNKLAAQTLDAKVLVVVPPPIQGLGLSGGFQMQLELKDGSFDYQKLQNTADRMIESGNKAPGLQHLMTSFRAQVPQVSAPINRTKAEALGVPVGDVFDTLQTYLGSSYVNLFSKFGQVFPVYVQADSTSRMTPDAVRNYYARSTSGNMVPIGTLTDIHEDFGPSIISLYNLYPTASIIGMVASGYSSGQGIEKMQDLARSILPSGLSYEWTGTAYQEKLAGSASYIIFALSLILVYFVLAGQYENWVTPWAVLLGVPLALIGTVLVLFLLKLANNIYTQIGLVLLIALSAKNAILIVEVARQARLEGRDIMEAAVHGAKIRFRPILMTSFAFIMGVIPLVVSSGAGAYARKSIGITVLSGMLASTGLAVLFVPSFYVVLQTWQEKRRGKKNLKY